MTPIKIYLADDDQEDRELFMDALAEIPTRTEITQFENGIDLMDELFSEGNLPKIIFLDLRMPIMDGFECLADIRSFKQFAKIKIVVYSSSYHQREVEQLEADGANQYLQKPTSFNLLKTLLHKCISPLAVNSDNEGNTSQFGMLT